MKTNRSATKQATKKPRHAFEIAYATNGKVEMTIYRRASRYSESGGAHAAAVVKDGTRLGRAALLRLAARIEEGLIGRSAAPICMDTDNGGCPYLWIESDGDAADLAMNTEILLAAAKAEGFTW